MCLLCFEWEKTTNLEFYVFICEYTARQMPHVYDIKRQRIRINTKKKNIRKPHKFSRL